jgi:hypothetical protein
MAEKGTTSEMGSLRDLAALRMAAGEPESVRSSEMTQTKAAEWATTGCESGRRCGLLAGLARRRRSES